MKSLVTFVTVLVLMGCGPTTPAATPTSVPPTVDLATPTRAVLPTAIDTFYNTPSTYTRQLGKHTQTIRLGVSPDFATRPILPFYGLGLTDPKFSENLFEAVTYNHFFRWQEEDWSTRSTVPYDEFKKRLADGEDLSYRAMDTRSGGDGAHLEKVNPAADLEILMIPRHDGFVTFPGSPTDPGLSIKNTIHPDGSVTVRVPLVYAQVIQYKAGDMEIQNIARSSIVLALMETGIPSDPITKNDLKGIATWWDTQPEKELHRYQYSYLVKVLSEPNGDQTVLHLWDEKPTTP